MEKSEFRRKLLSLVIPITMQQLMLSLVNVSDAVMLGFLNQDSLSAVSLAGQVQFVFNLFVFSVTGGISILAAQYWGINDKTSIEKIIGIGMKIMIPISIVFSAASFLCPRLLMKCFASDTILIEKGAEYLHAVSLSYFLLGISQIYLCIMKNCGHAGKSSLISSVSVVMNIILNWLLIFGVGIFPRMEIAGAAIATVISKAVELIWTMLVMIKKDSIKIRLSLCVHNDKLLKKDYRKYSDLRQQSRLGNWFYNVHCNYGTHGKRRCRCKFDCKYHKKSFNMCVSGSCLSKRNNDRFISWSGTY